MCNDLENKSRSLVHELNLGLVGIHNWCQSGDSTSKVKKVRDAIGFVMDRFVTNKFVTEKLVKDRFVTDRQMDREHFYSPPQGRRGTIIDTKY